MAIYLGGVLSGIASAYLILSTTFSSDAARRAVSVRICGLRGPLSAFITAWGGFTMITSAPFDNWWHAAYGLDVKIISPPHTLLMAGMLAIEIGALVLILSFKNRATDAANRSRLESLFLYIGGLMLVGSMIFVFEHTVRVYMHSASFCWIVALTVPWKLAALARASTRRWAMTIDVVRHGVMKRPALKRVALSLLLALGIDYGHFAIAANAHVGSPDVILEGDAGPHHLVVTIRPPRVIPGVADVEVLPGVRQQTPGSRAPTGCSRTSYTAAVCRKRPPVAARSRNPVRSGDWLVTTRRVRRHARTRTSFATRRRR